MELGAQFAVDCNVYLWSKDVKKEGVLFQVFVLSNLDRPGVSLIVSCLASSFRWGTSKLLLLYHKLSCPRFGKTFFKTRWRWRFVRGVKSYSEE